MWYIHSHFDQLLEVELKEKLISSVGDEGQVAAVCPNIQVLDISYNLLNSWQQVAALSKQLPKLHTLNVR